MSQLLFDLVREIIAHVCGLPQGGATTTSVVNNYYFDFSGLTVAGLLVVVVFAIAQQRRDVESGNRDDAEVIVRSRKRRPGD